MKLIPKGGNKVDINAVQGKTWELMLTIKNKNGTPLNLSNATLRGHIKRSPQDSVPVSRWRCLIVNPTEGKAKVVLSANETTNIPQGIYVFDLELELPDGKVLEIMRGVLNVEYEVTR